MSRNDADRDLHELMSSVADAVHLQEGEAGVARVLRAIHGLAPAPIRALSRHTGLPVPLVAAINNELRARGAVTTGRPSTLTPVGNEMVRRLGAGVEADPSCTCCDGHSLVIPDELKPVVDELAAITAAMPPVDLTLDQSYVTAESKVRRVLAAIRHRALPARGLLIVGDDDLVSLAAVAVGAATGVSLAERLAVVELSGEVLAAIADGARRWGAAPELVQHDLREPLPESLRDGFEVAVTDPPYTPEGARLFLSRAIEGLRPGPARNIVFSFGPKGPEEALQVQRSLVEMGLTVEEMHRNFNEYLGSGILASTSHLSILATTQRTHPAVCGVHGGALYTADKRGRGRMYVCITCGSRCVVGPDAQWPRHADLKAAGCDSCGGRRFRPLQLEPRSNDGPAR